MAKVGVRTATTETFPVTVADSVLTLNFETQPNSSRQATVAAIEVLPGDPVLATTAGLSSKAALNLYPNPTAGRFTVVYTAEEGQIATLRLTDAVGRQVYQQLVPLKKGPNDVPVSATGLHAGLYQLTLQVTNGQVLHRQVLVQP